MEELSFAETEIEVIGYSGGLGERGAPFVFLPLYGPKGSSDVLFPPFREEEGKIFADERVKKSDLQLLVKDGEVTLFDKPLSYQRDWCLYAPPGNGLPEYISFKDAADRLRKFAAEHRERGDNIYRQACREAFKEYALAAAASQEARDYARMLMVNGDGGHEGWLRDAMKRSMKKSKLAVTTYELVQQIKNDILARKG